MTKAERIIVSGFTGFLMCDWGDLRFDMEERLGRGVSALEIAVSGSLWDEITEAYRADFLALCKEEATCG